MAVAGHSEGALTNIWLVSGCCRDARLSGGVILASDDVGCRADSFAGATVPLLFIRGGADPLIPNAIGRAVRTSAMADGVRHPDRVGAHPSLPWRSQLGRPGSHSRDERLPALGAATRYRRAGR